jgi:multiple sugar transport system substrate-binding protein
MNAAPGFQWDVVTYPVNPKAPGVASGVNSTYLYVTSTTKHADDAFKVISVLLSEDVQTDMGRQGKTVPVLKDRSVLDPFGKDIPALQSKNVVALTRPKLAELQPIKYPFITTPATIAINAFNSVAFDGVDINTALREADELLNKEIQKFK